MPDWHGRGAPPWWPEGERWPPGPDQWHAMRGRFFRRIAIGLAALFGTLFLIAVLGWAIWGGTDYPL